MANENEDQKVDNPVEEPMPPDSLSPQLQRPDSEKVQVAPPQPANIPSQPAEDILDAPGGHNKGESNSSAEGQLVRKAQQFLENPSVRDQPDTLKENFLLEKGLSPPVVESLLSAQSGPSPPVPPRTYPKAPQPTSLGELIRTVARQFVRLFGVSASVLLIYFQFVLPSLSRVLHARHEIQAQRVRHIGHLVSLLHDIQLSRRGAPPASSESNVDAAIAQDNTPEAQASDEPRTGESTQAKSTVALNQLQISLKALSSSVRELNETKARNQDRSATLHTLTNLTGYISSQIHIPPASFAPSGRPNKPAILGPVEEEVRRELRALKGLALNRRSFVGASSLSTASSSASAQVH